MRADNAPCWLHLDKTRLRLFAPPLSFLFFVSATLSSSLLASFIVHLHPFRPFCRSCPCPCRYRTHKASIPIILIYHYKAIRLDVHWMKKPPPLEAQQQHQQHGRNNSRHRGLISLLSSLGAVLLAVLVCFSAARFSNSNSHSTSTPRSTTGTPATAATAAFLLRRPTGLLQIRGGELDDEVENGGVSREAKEASSSSSLSLWNHRLLQNDLNSCNETCCAPLIEAAAAAACPVLPAEDEEEPASSPFSSTPQWVQFVLMGVCLILSALFSGLTLGVMSLDISGLEIVMYV
jgi:hypothetical protein